MTRWSTRLRRPAGRPMRSLAIPSASALVLACLVAACWGGSPAASPTPISTAPSASAGAAGPTADAGPPAATLAADGGDAVVGQLGAFTWGDGGSDSPWLQGTPVVVGAGEPLTVSVAGGVGVAAWSARRVVAGTTDGSGAVGLGHGATPVTFAAPAPGSWSVQVLVTYTAGLGSGAYYWQVTVR